MWLTQKLATAISQLTLAALPADVQHAAKRSLLDALGAALAGSAAEETKLVLRAAKRWGGEGPCSVWGTTECLAGPHAALVNGTAAHAREVDDFGGCGHSGAVVVPAAIAAAELGGASGPDLLAAIVAGYEAAVRVIDALGGYHAHNGRGWHGTGTAGTFGAAAAAGRVLKLAPAQMAAAVGLAGTYAGGIWSFIVDGAMSKRLHAGKAAETGLAAACLAREGFTGPLAVLDDTWGSFTQLYGANLATPSAIVDGLGETWHGIYKSGFKPYACCRGIHGSLDAVFQVRDELGLRAEDVQQIIVRGSENIVRQLAKQDVVTVLDAQMSLPYSLALAFVVGRAGLNEYEPPYLNDERLSGFARRVQVVSEAQAAPGAPPIVELYLHDGRMLSRSVAHPKGESANPMSDGELLEKFTALAQRALPVDRAQRLAETVWKLDDLADVAPLLELLRSQPGLGKGHAGGED